MNNLKDRKKNKIGLLGGTFDPPHTAHLKLAAYVCSELTLDLVYFIPASIHAFKKNSVTPVTLRYEMIQAAIGEWKNFKISRIEMDRLATSYTVDTLKQFKRYEKIPEETELYYIIGMDNLYELHLWKDPIEIFRLAKVVILNRPGFQEKEEIIRKYPLAIVLASPQYSLSASEIRRKVKSGESITDLVSPGVEQIIRQHNLYRS
jgi:nicotinate-nucleotide adenylyltransferase